MQIKTFITITGLLIGTRLYAAGGGISCSTDADCTAWSYGENMSCGISTYCNAGTFYSCDSGTYYCALNCTGVCNNFFKVCDGSCIPQTGGCDPGTCGAPVCTPQGPCGGTCGNGICDTGEDSTNCPADCGGSPGTTTGGGTTTTLGGATTTTIPATTTTTAPSTTTTMSAPHPGAIDLQMSVITF